MDRPFHSHMAFVCPHLDYYITFPLEHWLPCFHVVGFMWNAPC